MDGEEKTYGGYEGPDAMYIKLISSNGHECIVKREQASTPGTIKTMLNGPDQFSENKTNEVNFREIPSHVLLKVCLYFANKFHYSNSSTKIPEFPVAPEIVLELLLAASFLDSVISTKRSKPHTCTFFPEKVLEQTHCIP
ncbi:elongin-C-like [Gorilla gorilla gorilla]|uniref:elongin-C-like n=1 Tax=Gorilla gorilla gorilla TaxID=9595 RepID=UPI0030084F83